MFKHLCEIYTFKSLLFQSSCINIFSYFFWKNICYGYLLEALRISTHNIYFPGEIRKKNLTLHDVTSTLTTDISKKYIQTTRNVNLLLEKNQTSSTEFSTFLLSKNHFIKRKSNNVLAHVIHLVLLSWNNPKTFSEIWTPWDGLTT